MTIRFILREILVARGISETGLAKRIGERPGTVNDVCRNEIKRLPVELMDKICKELDLDPGDWIKRKNKEE